MTKIEQLLSDLKSGSQEMQKKIEFFLRCLLKDRELYIFREIYGIGCFEREKGEIANEIGMSLEEIERAQKKFLIKLDDAMTKYPDYVIYSGEDSEEEHILDYNVYLKVIPAYINLKREVKNPAPLAKYANYTLAQFIYEYNNNGLKGRGIFDKLMAKLDPEFVEETPEDTEEETLNTVFPSTFSDDSSLMEAYRQMIKELLSYFDKTSTVPKNAKRASICDYYFNKHLTPKEIVKTANISISTIKDNFLIPLFRNGEVDHITLNPSFKAAIGQCLADSLYSPKVELQHKLQISDDDLLQLLHLFDYAVFEDLEKGQTAIIINRGDSVRVSECLGKFYSILNDELLPISKQDLYIKLSDSIIPNNWLPAYIDKVIVTHESVVTNSEGLISLKDEAIKGAAQRIRRIVYKSPSHTARKDDVIVAYKKMYGGEEPVFIQALLKEKGVFSISHGGVYQYSENGKAPVTVHAYIDQYIEEKILFRWSELLKEILKINPTLIEKSEKSYTTKRCTTSSNDPDILVLKGHESEYPQYNWKTPRTMNKTNFTINKAVELLRTKGDDGMPYVEFTRELNQILVANSIATNSTKTVISKYTNGDTNIFIQENGDIKLNTKVLADVSLDYIGLGYKYSDFYLSIYSLAISELKSKPGHKMLRSELAALAVAQISDEINGVIVNKAFIDRAKPDMLSVEGTGKNAYICLDITRLASDTSKDKQYKVADDDKTNQNESTPTVVVDTTPRPASTYRQIFNWPDIISMLKRELRHYDKPYFYQGITSDDVLEKFHRFMSQSNNVYLNQLIPQAYYELNYANVDRWSSYDYRSKMARAFESLLMDIYFQNRGVEPQTKGLWEILELAFADYQQARKTYDRNGFNGIFNNIYNDRVRFAHPTASEMPTLSDNIKALISYMALYVYTVAKYYKG